MRASQRVERIQRKQIKAEKPRSQASQQRAVGYVRVSTDGQLDGYGPEAQEDAIRSFARSQGYDLISVIQDNVTGVFAPLDRPGFRDVAKLAEHGSFSLLLVYKFDRLARDVLHAITTVHMLRDKYAVAIRSVTEPIDTATPMGEMIFTVLASMAAQERRTITERTWGGRKEKAKDGGYACGGVPIGYDVNGEGQLVVNETEAATVRMMFDLRRSGATYAAIAKTLNDAGHRTKRGNQWRVSGVAHVLGNPVYEGRSEYYFRRFGAGEHVLTDGTHKPIVERA